MCEDLSAGDWNCLLEIIYCDCSKEWERNRLESDNRELELCLVARNFNKSLQQGRSSGMKKHWDLLMWLISSDLKGIHWILLIYKLPIVWHGIFSILFRRWLLNRLWELKPLPSSLEFGGLILISIKVEYMHLYDVIVCGVCVCVYTHPHPHISGKS